MVYRIIVNLAFHKPMQCRYLFAVIFFTHFGSFPFKNGKHRSCFKSLTHTNVLEEAPAHIIECNVLLDEDDLTICAVTYRSTAGIMKTSEDDSSPIATL